MTLADLFAATGPPWLRRDGLADVPVAPQCVTAARTSPRGVTPARQM
ncbi:hypothetical protein MSM1_09155 [Mycobacterium sp. SM1]|nr:hypothetical protein [Mycobacterium sp. SM1]MBS4728500.1 hypothetical protein [Mycobacterium sp. SM1]